MAAADPRPTPRRRRAPSIPRSTRLSAPLFAASSSARSCPMSTRWDEAEEFPRELYKKAAAAGLMQLGFPEEYGGVPTDPFFGIIKSEELARHGSGGVNASLTATRSAARRSPPRSGMEKRKALPGCWRATRSARSRSPSRAAAPTSPTSDHGAARRRPLRRERREDVHHLRHARRLFHRRGAHRRAGRGRRLAAADRARPPGFSRTRSRRWAGGRPTPRSSASTMCACRSRT